MRGLGDAAKGVLYMAALVASCRNQVIQRFSESPRGGQAGQGGAHGLHVKRTLTNLGSLLTLFHHGLILPSAQNC